MGVGAERPKTWGGSSQKLGRIDRVWADRPVADRLWGGSTGTRPVSRALPATARHCPKHDYYCRSCGPMLGRRLRYDDVVDRRR